MNKILFLILSLILVACSPQVTVTSEVTVTLAPPTQTPIPTPTLHPEFIALQKLIADSSDRFSVLPDGTIEEVVVDGGRQTVLNLHVDQNGIINIIFNNEHVAIEQSQITFDDETGLSIEGYVLENGEWVVAMSEAMQTFQADFGKYNVPIDQYDMVEKEGNIVVTNPETGEIVYQNGSFEPLFLGQLIVENNMCKQTPFTATKVGAGVPAIGPGNFLNDYLTPVAKAVKIYVDNRLIPFTGPKWIAYYMGDSCWAKVDFKSEGQQDAFYAWLDPDGKLMYEYVFLPPKE